MLRRPTLGLHAARQALLGRVSAAGPAGPRCSAANALRRCSSARLSSLAEPLAEASSATAARSPLALALATKVRVPLVGQLSISEIFGHTAFALAATAFLDPDILNLRLLSVA